MNWRGVSCDINHQLFWWLINDLIPAVCKYFLVSFLLFDSKQNVLWMRIKTRLLRMSSQGFEKLRSPHSALSPNTSEPRRYESDTTTSSTSTLGLRQLLSGSLIIRSCSSLSPSAILKVQHVGKSEQAEWWSSGRTANASVCSPAGQRPHNLPHQLCGWLFFFFFFFLMN